MVSIIHCGSKQLNWEIRSGDLFSNGCLQNTISVQYTVHHTFLSQTHSYRQCDSTNLYFGITSMQANEYEKKYNKSGTKDSPRQMQMQSLWQTSRSSVIAHRNTKHIRTGIQTCTHHPCAVMMVCMCAHVSCMVNLSVYVCVPLHALQTSSHTIRHQITSQLYFFYYSRDNKETHIYRKLHRRHATHLLAHFSAYVAQTFLSIEAHCLQSSIA